MAKLAIMTALSILAVLGAATKPLAPVPTAAAPTHSISVDALHRQVDASSVPVLQVQEPF
jgi:hypothetical protein